MKPRSAPDRARPGAARSLPIDWVARVPILGPYAEQRLKPRALPKPPRSLRKRLLDAVKRKPPEAPVRAALPFVSPVIRRVRAPLERTASVMQVAREVRKPRTRWERLREAAREVVEDPVSATRWERLMGLGVALAAGGIPDPAPRRSMVARVLRKPPAKVAAPERGLRARLRRLGEVLNENAGPGRSRGRRGTAKKP